MKAYKIVIFIFSVIAALAVLCVIFPKDGIQVGPWHWEFPSLTEVLESDKEDKAPEESPEELLARRLRETRVKEESGYLQFLKNDPSRIQFPADNLKAWDEFFAALDNAGEKHLRILHYGDSQLEGDRMTSTLRRYLQQKFGGTGVGLLPLHQTVGAFTIGQSISPIPPRHLAYGPAELRSTSNRYGVMAQVAHLTGGTAHASFFPRGGKDSLDSHRYFTRLTVVTGNNSSTITAHCAGQSRSLAPTQGTGRLRFTLPDSTTKVALSLSGSGDVYGVMLDSETGVAVDNIPMRGCSGTMFTNINAAQLADFYKNENVRLIILQYGGNSVPYLKGDKSIETYANQIARQIKHIRQQAPQAAVLFIGPSDMSTRIKGKMQTYPALPNIIAALKKAAHSEGAAYWDMYEVMGGHNSMAQWVKAQPQLAGNDHIHFTRLGAERVGELLSRSLLNTYEYYKWRMADNTATAADSTQTVNAQ